MTPGSTQHTIWLCPDDAARLNELMTQRDASKSETLREAIRLLHVFRTRELQILNEEGTPVIVL